MASPQGPSPVTLIRRRWLLTSTALPFIEARSAEIALRMIAGINARASVAQAIARITAA